MIRLSVLEIEGGTLSVTEEKKKEKEKDWSWSILVVGFFWSISGWMDSTVAAMYLCFSYSVAGLAQMGLKICGNLSENYCLHHARQRCLLITPSLKTKLLLMRMSVRNVVLASFS